MCVGCLYVFQVLAVVVCCELLLLCVCVSYAFFHDYDLFVICLIACCCFVVVVLCV